MQLSLQQIVEMTGGRLLSGDPTMIISGVASLSDAQQDEASFLGNEKYYNDFLATRSGVVLTPSNLPKYPEGPAFVEVENPSMAFNAIVKYLLSSTKTWKPGVHPTAIIDPTAIFDPTQVCIGPHVVVEALVKIGNGTSIDAGCVLYSGAQIGENCKFYANVVVRERCRIGSHVTIQPAAIIGADGFGFLPTEDGSYVGIDQVGIVEIGDHVDIGANTAIDRARFGKTLIGQGTKIDNLVQIGHNAKVGKHCIIVAQSGVAGSSVLGDYVVLAAQVGVAGHLTVGDHASVAAQAGVLSNLKGNADYWGTPAYPLKHMTRQFIALRKLPDLLKEFNALKAKIDQE